MSVSLDYRRDIDGLRAIAVLSVVLYHFNVPGFAGGFVGVDIFFTISGYLIGTIVLRQLGQQRFSFTEFYARRIRRLFPAALVMTLTSMVLAHWLLLPQDYKEFGQSVGASLLYASNILFYLKAGYFDAASHSKPLLHTWSLCVEEQFYLVFPALAWLCARWLRGRYVALFATLTVLSLVAAQWYLSRDQSAVFYLYPFRAWEMFLGVALAALQLRGITLVPRQPALAQALVVLGLAMMAAAIFGFDKHTPFPGVSALLPCLGAALVLAIGMRPGALLAPMLMSRPMVFIGQISYSMYLWHWPIFVFYTYSRPDPLSLLESVTLLALTLVMSWASWRYVERPFRESSMALRITAPRTLALGAVCSMFPLVFAWTIHKSGGLPSRLDEQTAKVAAATTDFLRDWSGCVPVENARIPGVTHCTVGALDPATRKVVVWGDSHAAALKVGFFDQARAQGRDGIVIWKAGCPPAIGLAKAESVSNAAENESCTDHNRATQAWLREQTTIDSVVLVGRWAYYSTGTGVGLDRDVTVRLSRVPGESGESTDQAALFAEGLRATVRALRSQGIKVYVLEQLPEFEDFRSSSLAKALQSGSVDHAQAVQRVAVMDRSRLEHRQAAVQGVLGQLEASGDAVVLRTHQRFCNAERCNLLVDGVPAYFDNNHITDTTARRIRDVFEPALASIPLPAAIAVTQR